MRNLTTLILSGVLGSMVMAGNAEACHRKRCVCPTPAPAACATVYVPPAPCPVVYAPPAPCVTPVATTRCAPKVKHCFTMPKLFCHKKVVTCPTPTPVCYYAAAAPVSYSYTVSSPQASAQH